MSKPKFANKGEQIAYIVENKKMIMADKKLKVKYADALLLKISSEVILPDGVVVKAVNESESLVDADTLKAELVINTTNIMDSHSDVHLNGLWNQSLKQNKELPLLQEHVMSFKNLISDKVKAKTKIFTWKELGFDFEGSTQALVFHGDIDKEENPFMFDRYARGKVKNHSVGMQYVKMELAVSDDQYEHEFAVWEKYLDIIANKDAVIENGYFWAIKEARAIEGSAVLKGSNIVTPTLDVSPKGDLNNGTGKSFLASLV